MDLSFDYEPKMSRESMKYEDQCNTDKKFSKSWNR